MRWLSVVQVSLGLTLMGTPVFGQGAEEPPPMDDVGEAAEAPAEGPGEAPADTSSPPPMEEAEPEPTPPPDPVADAAPPMDDAAPMEPPPEDMQGSAGAEPEDFDEPNLCTGPFCQGSIGFTLLVGSASVGDLDYLIVGGGISYYFINGLAAGLDADVWFLEDPTIYTVTPQVKYVLHFIPVLKPYVGAFYRHYFLSDGFDDLDSIGGRVGAYLVTGGGTYLGLGGIYEKFLGCSDTDFRDCDGWYPEITLGFSL